MSFLPLSRRDMLRATAGATLCTAAGAALPGCGFDIDPAMEVAATADMNGVITLNLADAPRISAVGNSVILSQKTASPGIALPQGGVLVVRRTETEFAAVTALCTHQGCPLGYSAEEGLIACPCHGSRFLAGPQDGKCIGDVVRGPAVQAQRPFFTAYDPVTKRLTIDLTRTPVCGGAFVPTVEGGKVVLPFDKVPELMNPGGSYVAQPQGLADTLVVVRVDATTVSALSAVCTHQGCLVAFASANRDLECPCHGSIYDLTGAVTRLANGASSQAPLKKYTALLDATSITVTVS
jgi:cytochrome b6-f complex iron-sulfur subunit